MGGVELSVPDMSCGHCVKTIEAALAPLGLSGLQVDLGAKRVRFSASEEQLERALATLDAEGYPAARA